MSAEEYPAVQYSSEDDRPGWIEVCASVSGHRINPETWNKSRQHSDKRRQQSESMATRYFELTGESLYKETEEELLLWDFCNQDQSDRVKTLNQYRNVKALPDVASQRSQAVARDLSYTIENELQEGETCHYWVCTAGPRCSLAEVPAARRYLNRKLGKIDKILSDYGQRLLFKSHEVTYDEKSNTWHPHSNVVVVHTRWLRKPELRERNERVRAALGAHFSDNGRLKNVAEVTKYITKPDSVVGLSDADFVEFVSQSFGARDYECYSDLRRFRSDLKESGERVSKMFNEHTGSWEARITLKRQVQRSVADINSTSVASPQVAWIMAPGAHFDNEMRPVALVRLPKGCVFNPTALRYDNPVLEDIALVVNEARAHRADATRLHGESRTALSAHLPDNSTRGFQSESVGGCEKPPKIPDFLKREPIII